MSDIKNFFRLKLLDMKFIVDMNSDITAGEYFEDVDKFLNASPQFVLNLNHMCIIRNDNFFLNDLECFNNITCDIDDYYLSFINSFNNLVLHIGARNIAYMLDDLENHFKTFDLSRRNSLMIRVCTEVNGLYNTIRRVYSPKDEKSDLLASISVENERPWEQVPLKTILQELADEERTRKMQIVVVDDMPVVLNSVINILKKQYEAYAFTKGDQVLKFLSNKIPDLFILDIEMPEMGGYDLYYEIKKMKEHSETPIIFMTGNLTHEYIETAINMGVSDLIIKPVDEHILLKKVWNNLERKKLF